VLGEAYAPEATRKELATAIGQVLAILYGEDDNDSDDSSDEGENGDEDSD
jgi:hypothetical protein